MITQKSLMITGAAGLLSLICPVNAAVTPGGTLGDKVIITESGGGEVLPPASGANNFGTPLVHDFDTSVAVDGSYEIVSPSTLALSSGRHLVMYSTRFDASGTNRSEILTNLTLAGSPIAAGRSQGYTRLLGGADEAIMSGGAIINVANDDDILTLESLRSDVNGANVTSREPDATSVQAIKLDDSWDYLSLQRDTAGSTIGETATDVVYDANNSSGTMGTAFSFTTATGDITLNETGLYLVFANTGFFSTSVASTGVRTCYQQWITLDNTEVTGSKTTTYVRGNGNAEDARNGIASIGILVSATAGQTLNVEVAREAGGYDGIIQGGQTALTIVKLPSSAQFIELTDSTNQNVVNGSATPISFNTLVSPASTSFSHAGNTVTANNTGDYLFFGSLFTISDGTNDNNDRVVPLTRWRLNGTDILNRGQATSYNRDAPGNRTSSSWNSTLLSLNAADTVQLMSQNIGTASPAFPNTPKLQGLSISSLILIPHLISNEEISPAVTTTQTITASELNYADGDTAPSGLTYTIVNAAPTGGTLNHTINGPIGLGGTFTQDDINNNRIEFIAGSTALAGGGFDFEVSDGTSTISDTFVINVIFPITTLTISGDGPVAEGGVAGWTITATPPPNGDDVTVNILYSGNNIDGSDFTSVASITLLNGASTADLDVTILSDGVLEGVENLTATIDSVTSSLVSPMIGTPAAATVAISDSGNNSPTATKLEQVVSGTGAVPLDDIVISEPDTTYNSTVTTAGSPLFVTNGIANETVFSDGRPNSGVSFTVNAGGNPSLVEADGFSVEIAFIPQPDDLIGVVDVWEIGGSSNGSAILLVDGVPHLLSKAGGGPADTPTDNASVPGAFTDLDWASDDTIVVPLNGATALLPGLPARLAVIYDMSGNTVKSSVNGSAEATATLINNDATNWIGDHSVNTGINAGSGTGGSSTPGGLADQTALKNLVNGASAVSSVRFWNEATGSITPTTGSGDEVTASLTISDWTSAANGTLSATSGNGETFSAGVWSVTGDAAAVNAALAAVEFITGASTADPTTITVSLDDGDEDGSGPDTGTLIITATAPDPIYVDDDFSGNLGDAIADADGGSPVAPALFGVSAFATLTEAMAAVTPTGTIIVNDGDYSTENIDMVDSVILQLTDTAGPVQIGDITTLETNSIDIQSNTLELGGTNVTGAGINAPITGTGNLTKVGTGLVTIRGVNTYTGTTTISDGILRIGRIAGSIQGELAGDGPVIVNAPGRFELVVNVDTVISQTGLISGTGSVGTLGEGTLVFDGAGPNTFSGGFILGDGGVSSFDGIDGAKEGFVVVNHNGHLGTGPILSRGAQLQAGSSGLVIPNDVNITAGGFRNGGSIDYELSGNMTAIDGSPRGFGNYGLEGCDLTISGNISATTATGTINFEASPGKDNGTWTVTGDISGPQSLTVVSAFTDGVVTLSGNLTYAGTTILSGGTTVFNATQTGGSALFVTGTAILTGDGSTTSPVTIEGSATLNPGIGAGSFTTGDLTINGTLEVDLDNNTPGIGHDQIIVNGVVTLGASSNLAINAGAGLTPGALIIIDNDGTGDASTGVFTGLPEGGALDAAVLELNATVGYAGGDGNDVTINFASYTPIGLWRATYYDSTENVGAGENSVMTANGLTNLQSFALDLDPTTAPGMLNVNAGTGTITTLGPPSVWVDPADGRIYLRHTRRTDFAAIPLTITDQFSRDLMAFEDSSVAPVVIATGTGDSGVAIEAVQTEFPLILPVNGGKARFGRVEVTNP